MSMITASTWVPRGAAAIFPTKYKIDEDEIARISELAKLQLEDARESFKAAKNGESDAMDVEDSSPENFNPINLSRSKGYHIPFLARKEGAENCFAGKLTMI